MEFKDNSLKAKMAVCDKVLQSSVSYSVGYLDDATSGWNCNAWMMETNELERMRQEFVGT